jgi:hypothetical protein
MIGLEVKYKDNVFEVALDGAAGIYIEHRCSDIINFDISGVDKTHVYNWIEANHLNIGDEIIVTVKDDMPAASNVKRKYTHKEMTTTPMSKEEIQGMWHEKLMKFRALEKKLKDERLIQCEQLHLI